jgi:translation elongation factor P/translation initiation factor 5A
MKTAQEIRVGNVIMHGKDPMVVLRTEYQRGGRGSSTVRMKLKSLIANFGTEVVFRADDKMDQVILDKKDCTYSYFADPMYVCMDTDFNQYEVEATNMGDALNYLEDGMELEVVFHRHGSARAFVREPRRQDRNRHPHGRIPQARLIFYQVSQESPARGFFHAPNGFLELFCLACRSHACTMPPCNPDKTS